MVRAATGASRGPYVSRGCAQFTGGSRRNSVAATRDCGVDATPLSSLRLGASRLGSAIYALRPGPGFRGADGEGAASSAGSHVGPQATTRLAMRHHSATWASLALIQFTGTGARRRFSPPLAKQSQPELNSVATAPRLPGCARRSPITRCSMRKTAFSTGDRRSIRRRSIEEGCTIHTSHIWPLASGKLR